MSKRTRTRLVASLAVLAVGVLVTAGALNAQRDDQWAALGVDPEWTNFRAFVTELPLGYGNPAWQAFETEHPGEWRAQWDSRTGIPHLLYGPGIDTGQSGLTEATATGAAFDLIEEHQDLFGLRGFDLDVDVVHGGNTWYVDSYLFHEAIPFTEWTRFAVRIKDNGVIAAIKTYDIPADVEPAEATIGSDTAVNRVMASLLDGKHGELFASDPELNYLVDNDGVARLVWRFEVRNRDLANPFGKEYFVHARDDVTVYKIEELIHYDFSGSVQARILPQGPNDGTATETLEDARVTITAGGSGSAFTDANGNFSFPGDSGTRTIRSRMDGRWTDVNNTAGGDLESSITNGPGNNFNFDFQFGDEFRLAEQNAHRWTTDVHNFTSAIMGNNGVEFELPTNVNINNTCNAFWDGSSINFFRAGGGCPNTAHDGTIVAHEYGHGIDSGRGGILSGQLSEGFSDAVAMALTDQHCAGIDFFGPGTCLRSGNDVRLWPATECGGQVHCVGSVYAQFTWQFTLRLKQSLGQILGRQKASELVLIPALANPSDIPDTVFETFVADDDNGDLGDGTPNYDDLADAALSRNLPFPEVPAVLFSFPDGVPDFLEPGGTTVRVDVVPNRREPAEDSGTLFFRFNGGNFVSQPMTSIGPNMYETTIPSQNCFDEFDFYFTVGLQGGGTASEPFDAPNSFFSALVATSAIVRFEDDFEQNLGWTVVNENLQDGPWQRGIPAGDGSRRDPTEDFDGSGRCFLTDNVAGNSDVDGGPTRLISPTMDLSNDAFVSFAFWHSNDDGDDPFHVEVSNDNGNTWSQVLTQFGGDDGWQTHQFLLSDEVAPSSTVKLRFSSTDNPNNSVTESGVDAVKAVEVSCEEEPDPLQLFQTPLVRGEDATFTVTNAEPESTVIIFWTKQGVDPEMGPCPPELGGLCLDLIGNVRTLVTRTSNSQGQIQFTRQVPTRLNPITVHTQAANVRGPGGSESVKSNTVTDTIQ